MRTKILKFGVLAIVAGSCAVLLFQYIHPSQFSLAFAQTSSELTARIIIPRIHINAVIEEVSKNSDGLPNSPKSALNAGWYKLGPRPGEEGSAVIVGDVHWKYGYTARFGDLHFLEMGDIVVVKDDRGVITSFVVRKIKTYDLNADIGEVFFSNDGKSHLNLITSDGIWDKLSESYFKRLAIFTDKEMATSTLP